MHLMRLMNVSILISWEFWILQVQCTLIINAFYTGKKIAYNTGMFTITSLQTRSEIETL